VTAREKKRVRAEMRLWGANSVRGLFRIGIAEKGTKKKLGI